MGCKMDAVSRHENIKFPCPSPLRALRNVVISAIVLSCFSCVFNLRDPTDYQAPLSMEFSRQEYWGGLPCAPPGDLPNPLIKFLLHWQADSLPLAPPGKHCQ
ncbi:unnamed protein product [Rangifer tarandus platyrhynchus]|uniref:Uncharacterized protein n=2 Tax=Rangifer tarandus platyrhynchus TaxID=3082113 RepID=A0AC59Z471_RANTA|nr:unnamed protein product [Rangifer tarandus platyrhynchus]